MCVVSARLLYRGRRYNRLYGEWRMNYKIQLDSSPILLAKAGRIIDYFMFFLKGNQVHDSFLYERSLAYDTDAKNFTFLLFLVFVGK